MRKISLVIAVSIASPVWGANIYTNCAGAPDTNGYAICNSYINGFAGGILIDQIAKEEGTPICIPDNTTTDQIREIIIKYGKANPHLRDIQASAFIGSALINSFPCKKSN